MNQEHHVKTAPLRLPSERKETSDMCCPLGMRLALRSDLLLTTLFSSLRNQKVCVFAHGKSLIFFSNRFTQSWSGGMLKVCLKFAAQGQLSSSVHLGKGIKINSLLPLRNFYD